MGAGDYSVTKKDHESRLTTIGGTGCAPNIYLKYAFQMPTSLVPFDPSSPNAACDPQIPFEIFDI
jgi:hypothetical protein